VTQDHASFLADGSGHLLLAGLPPGPLLALVIILPLAGLVPLLLAGPRVGEWVAMTLAGLGLAVATIIALQVWWSGTPAIYHLGGWRPPLGIALRADGVSSVMLVMSAAVFCGIGLFATTGRDRKTSFPPTYWMLSLCVASGLNLAFLAQDLFTLYVALELLTFAAVPLVCLEGKAAQLEAALTYLLFALLGSLLYLLGAVLIYAETGTLDIGLAGQRLAADSAMTGIALALMSAGLAAKAALFPLYLWLPPAHAGAPPAASALLSSLVIKAPIFLLLRIWLGLAPADLAERAAPVLAILGTGAILFCGLRALGQTRLKLLIAYSTAAQLGYVFLMLPLVKSSGPLTIPEALAWTGGFLHIVSHAFAKAAMFMAAGVIAEALGHDRIRALGGAAQAAPLSVAAFAIGGLSLMGLPPSGGFVAKVMLLTAAIQQGVPWIAVVVLAGGLLAGGYVLRVVVCALQRPEASATFVQISLRRQAMALVLAVAAIVLGFIPLEPMGFLLVGRP
jgi:multicomponent Na+:H+ antiporter subunit D